MAPVIHIDVPWLLQRHEEVLPDQPTVNDFSALVAAVARHRVDPPRLGVDSDPAWRAAALLHTLALLKPLPSANARFACATAVAYMFVSDVGIDPPLTRRDRFVLGERGGELVRVGREEPPEFLRALLEGPVPGDVGRRRLTHESLHRRTALLGYLPQVL